MKIPNKPPDLSELIQKYLHSGKLLDKMLEPDIAKRLRGEYHHWDELQYRTPADGLSRDEWWFLLKLQRTAQYRSLPLHDKNGEPFVMALPDLVLRMVERVEQACGRTIASATNSKTVENVANDLLLIQVLEESITSSQLEGAATTRRIAKEMILSNRKPKTRDERMIFNNYRAMEWIAVHNSEKLSPETVFHLHCMLTEGTLDNEDAAGRFRGSSQEESVHVVDPVEGTVYHSPPPADELPHRLNRICDFANMESSDDVPFIPIVVKAIVLHFMLAYDHPFVDGNGRTARALFYWFMLRNNYDIFKYLSISTILRNAPAKYELAFLFTETDDNDLTYFILHQLDTILRGAEELREHVEKKKATREQAAKKLRSLAALNLRQQVILEAMLQSPDLPISIEAYRKRCKCSLSTARSDLLAMETAGYLIRTKSIGKKILFRIVPERVHSC